jgi:hypothetical protein
VGIVVQIGITRYLSMSVVGLEKTLRHKGLERTERSGVTPAKPAVSLLTYKRKAGMLGKVAKH